MARIYYTGDMANQPGWFNETASDLEGHVGNRRLVVELVEEGGERSFAVHAHHIGDVYRGHCDPRFVTEEAYNTYHAARRI